MPRIRNGRRPSRPATDFVTFLEITVAAFILQAALVTPTEARNAHYCEELVDVAIAEQKESWRDWIARNFFFWRDSLEQENTSAPENAEYWYTINEGTALTLDCDHGATTSLYYPIGLILKKLHTFETGRKDKSLFLSEYGIDLIISEDDVAKLQKDHGYIFANGIGQFDICINSAEQNPDCDARQPDTGADVGISAKYGYFVTEDNPVTSAQFLGFFDWDRESRYVLEPGSDSKRDDLSQVCGDITGKLYNRGKRPEDEPEYLHTRANVCTYLNPDNPDPEGLMRKPFKAVNHEIAEIMFSDRWRSVFFRRVSDLNPVVRAIRIHAASIFEEKACGREFTRENQLTLGEAVRLGVETPVVDIEFKHSVEVKSTLLTTFDKNEGVFVSAHIFKQGQEIEENPAVSVLNVNDIFLTIRCDEKDKPQIAEKLVIAHPEVDGHRFTLWPEDLRSEYLEKENRYGGPPVRLKTRYLDAGVFWNIGDYQEYFRWRDRIRRHLFRRTEIQQMVLSFELDKHELIDYFTHLIMASTFSSTVGSGS